MSGIILSIPILAGKVEAWRRFCQELSGSQLQMYLTSRRRIGITFERMALVETAFGSTAVNSLEALNVDQALAQIITSNRLFDVWYRKRLQELHGVDLTVYKQFLNPSQLPIDQEVHFEWALDQNQSPKNIR